MTIVALCGYGRRLVNRNSPLLRALNRAVMPIYLLHQPVLAVAMLGLAPLALAEPMERIALIALTALGSWSVYRAFDASGLRMLLGLSAPPGASNGLALPTFAKLRAAGD
jgi:peptidoglycan/LPS O-acetylase OafA/YrhL